MPHSWVRVSTQTSRKIRDCQCKSRPEFENCVKGIVSADDGTVEGPFYYEHNGKWARLLFEWPDAMRKEKIVYDLEGVDVVDVFTLAEAEEFDRRIAEADATQSE